MELSLIAEQYTYVISVYFSFQLIELKVSSLVHFAPGSKLSFKTSCSFLRPRIQILDLDHVKIIRFKICGLCGTRVWPSDDLELRCVPKGSFPIYYLLLNSLSFIKLELWPATIEKGIEKWPIHLFYASFFVCFCKYMYALRYKKTQIYTLSINWSDKITKHVD